MLKDSWFKKTLFKLSLDRASLYLQYKDLFAIGVGVTVDLFKGVLREAKKVLGDN